MYCKLPTSTSTPSSPPFYLSKHTSTLLHTIFIIIDLYTYENCICFNASSTLGVHFIQFYLPYFLRFCFYFLFFCWNKTQKITFKIYWFLFHNFSTSFSTPQMWAFSFYFFTATGGSLKQYAKSSKTKYDLISLFVFIFFYSHHFSCYHISYSFPSYSFVII